MNRADDAAGRDTNTTTPTDGAPGDSGNRPESTGDLNDLLQELRVLLQGVQVLTGFLIVLPFSEGFARVSAGEKRVYIAIFLCVMLSLILFSAPAAQHRLLTPLRDRVEFKRGAARMVIGGMVPLSVALVLSTHFVLNEVTGPLTAKIGGTVAAVCIAALWWITPLLRRRHHGV